MFGSGLNNVNFNWIVLGETYYMTFFGGFVGTGYRAEQNCVMPIFDYGAAYLTKRK